MRTKIFKQFFLIGTGLATLCLMSCTKPSHDECCEKMVTACYSLEPCYGFDGREGNCPPWGASHDPDTVVAYLHTQGIKKVEKVQIISYNDSGIWFCGTDMPPKKIMLDVCEEDLDKVIAMGFTVCEREGYDSSNPGPCNTGVTARLIGCHVTGLWGGVWLQLDNGEFLQPWESSMGVFQPVDGQRFKISYTEVQRDNRYDSSIVCMVMAPVPVAAAVKITCIAKDSLNSDQITELSINH